MSAPALEFTPLPPTPAGERMACSLEEIARVMNASIRGHERSQQVRIGPSEIGTPCNRALLMKIAEIPEPGKDRISWKPTVGTALHAQQEAWFARDKANGGGIGWEIEERVTVGTIGQKTITGSTDLFIPETATVTDWKFLGPKRLDEVRGAGKPKDLYKVQAHLYGRGWAAEGYDVRQVMIVFLPREGEIGDTWTEPEETAAGWWMSTNRDGVSLAQDYDEQVAIDALARADGMAKSLALFGLDALLATPAFARCKDRWCAYCNPPRTSTPAQRRPGHVPNTQLSPPGPDINPRDPFTIAAPALADTPAAPAAKTWPAPVPVTQAAQATTNPFTI